MRDLQLQVLAVLLISLRIAPLLAFSPPFTLLRIPPLIRLMLAVSLAAWVVSIHPEATWQVPLDDKEFSALLAGELALGITLALVFQLAFGALLTAGRTIDIQAGFGLAALVDPTTKAQMPLIGTLLAYATAAFFFAAGGTHDLLAIWAESVVKVPLGTYGINGSPDKMIEYCTTVFVLAFGTVGIVLLTLFLLDSAIALLSRTMPQMNVLLVGFQVKVLATLAVLPIAFAVSGATIARLVRYAIETATLLV